MKKPHLKNLFVDQCKDAIWMVDHDFQLVYANKAYLHLIKEVAGVEKKINESAFIEVLGEDDIDKWKGFYTRALKGEYFEIQEHYFNPKLNKIQFSQTSFEPIIGDDNSIVTVACQSKDITRIVKHKSEASQLIGASLDVFCSFNTKGEFVYVSASAYQHWGYTPEEILGKLFIDFVLEADIAKTNESLTTVFEGKKIKSFFNRYLKKDGSIAFNLWSLTWDNDSKLIYAVARDGKETIEQEEKLVRSEQRFKALVQGGNDLYAIIDLEGRYIYMSPSSTAIIGIPPEAFIGMDAFEFIHPDDLEQTQASLKKIVTEGKVVMEHYRAKNQYNEWRWVETVLTNMLDYPAVNGIVVNSRDITKEIKEKHQLKLLESVITNTNDAILITEAEPFDEPGPKIIYVNEAFTKMTGYEAEEVIGKTPRILQGPNSNKEELAKLGRSIRNWEPYEITTINYKKSGEEFWINFTVTPVANEKGWYTHWIAIERDVTDQKNRELEKDLIRKINSIFNQSIDNDLPFCLTRLCQQITEFGDFDFSEIWLPALDDKRINRIASYAKSKAGSTFNDTAKQLNSLDLGEGLSGFVWKNKTIEVWENSQDKWVSKRKAAANKAGIECMMGIPLNHKGNIVGVLLIGTIKEKSFLTKYSDIFKRIEVAISAELSRKNVEIELAQIFDFTPDMICVAGFDGFIKRMNPAGLEILGYSLDEIRSKPITSFMHKEDRLITQNNQQELYKGKKLQSFENRYITKKGNTIWLSWTATSAPEYGIVYAAAKNITEEKKLRELNRQVGQLAKIGSWEFNVVNNTLFWSDEVHQIYGTESSSFVPNVDAAINFYREDYRDLARSSFEKCILTQEPYAIEAVIVNSSNKEVWVHTTAKAEVVDGVCTRVYGSFQNIDDRKQSEIRLQSLASNLPGVLYQYLVNPDGTDSVRNVSEGSEYIWGLSREAAVANIQLVWDQIKAGGELKKVQKSISQSIELKTNWTCRYKYMMPSGELRTYLGMGTPSFLTDGTILFNSITLDITQEAKNEELLKEVTNMARIGSWEMDLNTQNGDSIYWSPILREIVEVDDCYDPTLTGGIELHVGESKERIQKAIDLLIHEGIEFDEEVLLLTAKGNERWNRCIGKSEMVNGKRTKIYGSYQDIHHRKKSELELLKAKELAEENELKMKEAQRLAHIGSWYYDVINQVSQWSEETYNIWGLNRETTSIDYIDHQKLIHPKDWERFNSVINNAIEKGIPYKMDLELVRPDGSYKTVNTLGEPIFDENNTVIAFKGTTQDISDRIIIENELRSAVEKAEKSLKSLEDYKYSLEQSAIITFTDSKGIITSVNDNFCKISKYDREEIIGKTYLPLKSGHHPKEFFKELWGTISSGNVWRGEIKNRAKDGSHYWVDTTIVPFLDENNKPLQYLAVRFDITERKKAEESLKSATERLRIATSGGNIGIWDWDILNDHLIWDETMYRIFGVEENEFQGAYQAFEAKVHPDDLDDTNEKVQNALKGLSKFKTEFRIVLQDKSIRYISGEAVVVYEDNTGKPTRLIGYNVDITERKVAEQEKTSLQETIENSLNEIYTFDAETYLFTYANHGALLNLGYSEQEIKTLTPLDIKPDFSATSFQKLIAPLLAKEKEKIIFFTDHQRKDGGRYPAEIHLQLAAEGNTERFLAIVLDITERKKAEEENRFKANLLSTVGQAAIATNLDGIVQYWNKAAENIYGWKAEEAIGTNIMQLTPTDTNKKEAEQIIQMLNRGEIWSGEFKVQKKDGTTFPALITNSPIYDEDNRLSGIIGISTDNTKEVENKELLKQYTHELERSNEELEQFAFIASHDLQEPLRMISSFMNQLERKYGNQLDEKAHQYIYFAKDGAKRMKEIILDLLEYSRANKPTEGKEEVDLNQVFTEFKLLRKKLISEKSAQITSSPLPTLYTYKAVVIQILHCLLDNAIKYAKADIPPIIEIIAKENKTEWKFSIKDNGIGIDPKFHDKIFVIFQRLHNRDEYDGTGIGLSIAKRHVELLKGQIWLDSKPGEGTVFYFTIPKN